MKIYRHKVTVEWGDCDPAGIVFYPNYYRWMDEATFHLFDSVGLGWEELRRTYGAPGLPLIATQAEFRIPCFFRDQLDVEVAVSAWGNRSLTVGHRFLKNGAVAVEGWEKRVWSAGGADADGKLNPAPIPQAVKDALDTGK